MTDLRDEKINLLKKILIEDYGWIENINSTDDYKSIYITDSKHKRYYLSYNNNFITLECGWIIPKVIAFIDEFNRNDKDVTEKAKEVHEKIIDIIYK